MICWFLAGCLVGGPIGFFGARMVLDRWENRSIEKLNDGRGSNVRRGPWTNEES